jgi:hypothetical protein
MHPPSSQKGNHHSVHIPCYSHQLSPHARFFKGERNSPIAHTINKRLAPILRPQTLIIKPRRIPHHLEHDLRQLDGMRSRTRITRLEGSACWVRDVALMVGAVGAISVPAGGKCDRCADAASAHAFRERCSVAAGAKGAAKGVEVLAEAAVADFARSIG